ncbi:MAG: hypothetical protein JOZ41_07215 [Chloroflexi bacterium]|nr:hypothetical protein [Chloroflexota bacterium]
MENHDLYPLDVELCRCQFLESPADLTWYTIRLRARISDVSGPADWGPHPLERDGPWIGIVARAYVLTPLDVLAVGQ